MSSAEALALRERLGSRVEDLATDLGVTPGVVEAWESGAIGVPRSAAGQLRWRAALAKRDEAMESAGLPQCDYAEQWWREVAPKLKGRNLKRAMADLDAHFTACPVCQARAEFAKTLPSIPDPPLPGVVGAMVSSQRWINARPEWMRPALRFGGVAGALILFRVVLMAAFGQLGSVHEVQTAATVLFVVTLYAACIGAVYGLLLPLRRRGAAGTVAVLLLTAAIAIAPGFAMTSNQPSDVDPTPAQFITSWGGRVLIASFAVAVTLGWWTRRRPNP